MAESASEHSSADPSHPSAVSPRGRRFLAAVVVSFVGTGLSRVLGAVRDMAIAYRFGAGGLSDAFLVAFTVPSAFRRFVADEGLTGAMIPAFRRAEQDARLAAVKESAPPTAVGQDDAVESDPEVCRRLAAPLFFGLLLINLVLCTAGVVFAEPLVHAFAEGFSASPEKFNLTVRLTRWLFPFVAMVSVVSYFEGLLNFRGHFFIPKVAPGLVSAGIAGFAFWGTGLFDPPVLALAAGVLVGGAVHVLFCLPAVVKHWGWPRLSWRLRDPRVVAIGTEMLKVAAIGVLAQVNILVLRRVASMVGDGAVTHYWYAARLVDLAQGMAAVAIGSAILPVLSESVAKKAWATVAEDVAMGMRLIAFVLLPSAACLTTFALPITAAMFRRGDFSAADVAVTANTLRLLTPFLLAAGWIHTLKRVFFAFERRGPLLLLAALGVALTWAIGAPLCTRYGVAGLGAALSLSTVAQLGGYLVLLRVTVDASVFGGVAKAALASVKMLFAALPAAALCWLLAGYYQVEHDFRSPLNALLLVGGLGGAAFLYLLFARLLGISEARRLLTRVGIRI